MKRLLLLLALSCIVGSTAEARIFGRLIRRRQSVTQQQVSEGRLPLFRLPHFWR